MKSIALMLTLAIVNQNSVFAAWLPLPPSLEALQEEHNNQRSPYEVERYFDDNNGILVLRGQKCTAHFFPVTFTGFNADLKHCRNVSIKQSLEMTKQFEDDFLEHVALTGHYVDLDSNDKCIPCEHDHLNKCTRETFASFIYAFNKANKPATWGEWARSRLFRK
jgi:hypothetical protein